MKYTKIAVLFVISGVSAYYSSISETSFVAWLFMVSFISGFLAATLFAKYVADENF